MKIGRNDPCPCGSGKKYKKCCMAKDVTAGHEHMARQAELQREAEALQMIEPEPRQPPPLRLVPPDPDDMLDEMLRPDDPLWDEFESTPADQLLTVFKRFLSEEEDLDNDTVFEMVCAIRDKNSRQVFAEAMEALRSQRADLYAADQQHYLDWQIADALIAGNNALLPTLCDQLVEVASYDLESFQDSLKKLSYYGHTEQVSTIMLRAVPELGKQQDLFEWVPDEFATQTIDMSLYKHYEQHPDLHADHAGLQTDLSQFEDITQERLPDILDLLTGRRQPQWSLSDFAFRRPSKKQREEDDPAVQKLYELLLIFVGSLWRKQHVPLAKTELARNALYHYILRRHAGDIQPVDEDDDDTFGFAPFAKSQKSKRKPQYHPINILCPDRATLDAMVASMINMLSADYYTAAAFVELIPAWIAFLVDQKLLGADQATLAMQDIYQLVELAQPIWEKGTGNPHIQQNIEQAWS